MYSPLSEVFVKEVSYSSAISPTSYTFQLDKNSTMLPTFLSARQYMLSSRVLILGD